MTNTNIQLWRRHISVPLVKYEADELFSCNFCGIERKMLTNWYRDYVLDKDVCAECNLRFYDMFTIKTNNVLEDNFAEKDTSFCCDICKYTISNTYYTNYNVGLNICNTCYDNKKQFGINMNQSGFMSDRYIYIIAKRLKPSDYVVPEELIEHVTFKRNEAFINLINYIVKPPNNYNNILEWTLITDMVESEHSDSYCGIMVNCVRAPYAVASLVEDNHGRVAIDIIYDNYKEYLSERTAFNPKKMKLTRDPNYDHSDSEDETCEAELEILSTQYNELTCTCKNIEPVSVNIKKKNANNTEELKCTCLNSQCSNNSASTYESSSPELELELSECDIYKIQKPKTFVFSNFEEYIRRKNKLEFYYG